MSGGPHITHLDDTVSILADTVSILAGDLRCGDGALLFTGGSSARHPIPSHARAGLVLE